MMDGGKNHVYQMLVLGFAVLCVEVVATRLASAKFQYHFAFLAISLAMLSFFISGALFSFFDDRRRQSAAKIAAISLPPILLAIPFALGASTFVFIAGMTIALAFGSFWVYKRARGAFKSRELGAAAGLLAFSIVLLAGILALIFAGTSVDGYAAVLVIFLLCALVAGSYLTLYFLEKSKGTGKAYGANLIGAAAGAGFAMACLAYSGPWLALFSCAALCAVLASGFGIGKKEIAAFVLFCAIAYAALSLFPTDDRFIFEKWTPYSYVRVFGSASSPITWANVGKTGLKAHLVQIDSGAGTSIVLSPQDAKGYFSKDITHIAYYLLPEGAEVAIIGSGGGKDVIGARDFNVSGITAIEINPAVIEAVEKISPQTYSNATLIVGEGRASVRAHDGKFNLIQLGLVDTWAAVSSGAFALTENYLYTREAFSEFRGSLVDGGYLSVTHWCPYGEKLHALAVETYGEKSVVAVKSDEFSTPRCTVTVIAKKGEISAQEREIARKTAEGLGFSIAEFPPYNGEKLPSDNSPFFFFSVEGGKIVFFVAFAALAIALAFYKFAMGGKSLAIDAASGVYFASIGIGYLALESVYLQMMFLIFANPTLAVAFVFAVFLLSSGAGSMNYGRIGAARAWIILPLIFASLIIWLLFGSQIMALGIVEKLFVSLLMIAPPAFFAGFFFPYGFERMKMIGADAAGFGWAANGLASVVAPGIALLLAIYSGFSTVLLAAFCMYGIASFLANGRLPEKR